MTSEVANQIYQCLVTQAGASEDEREAFVRNMTSPTPAREWRFQGRLGFGGKYRSDRNTVDYYYEDATPEREAIAYTTNVFLNQILTNNALALLRTEMYG